MKQRHLDNAEEVFYNINMSFNTQQKKIKIIAQALAKAERKGRKATIEEIEKFINVVENHNPCMKCGSISDSICSEDILKKLQEMKK